MTSSPSQVFVYGTLKPGQSRWSALARFLPEVQPAFDDVVVGQLWDTSYGWPAMTVEPPAEVAGVVVVLDPGNADAALHELDAIEGVDVGLFKRVLVRTRAGRQCWTYVWGRSTAGFIPLGRTWPPATQPC